jgi:hypothetical protein
MYQVVVGSFLANEQHEQKLKTQKNEVTSTVTPTAAAPVSTAGTIPNLSSPSSFHGDYSFFVIVHVS